MVNIICHTIYHNGLISKLTLCQGYIGEFEIVDDHRAGKIVVELVGRINKCGVISPRFDIALSSLEQWTSDILPSRQFGYIVLTTSAGIMDHEEARRKHTGGKVYFISFVYVMLITFCSDLGILLLKNRNKRGLWGFDVNFVTMK